MKIQTPDGSWLVAIDFGGIVRCSTLEHAEKVEASVITARKWGISLSVGIVVLVMLWMIILG